VRVLVIALALGTWGTWLGAAGCDEKSHNINPATTGGADTTSGGGSTDGGGGQDAPASSADGSYSIVDGVIVAQDAQAGADAPPPPEPGAFGAPCLAGGDCESGYCFQGPDGRVCTDTCAGDCPDGYRCRPVSAVGSDLCVPLPRSGCRPCAGDFQCGGGACLRIDGEDRCAPSCETGDDCLHGAVCAEDPAGEREGTFCLPATGSCSCDASVAGGVRMCAVTNEVGTCPGLETCDPAAGWGGCSALTPTEELCNGLDDDCDGLVDDGLPETQPCERAGDGEGLGTCRGEAHCAGAGGWVCDAPEPTAEVCDGQDNDCDGETDEDFRDEAGFWTRTEHCGSCGNDCTTLFPHGQGACGGTPDAPVCVVASCDPGYWKINEGGCVAVPDLACQPCLTDADCLGGTCADLQGERRCVMPCADAGAACPDGYTCQPAPLAPGGDPGGASPGEGPNRCVPNAGSCSCTEEAAAQGFTRPCGIDSQFGKCLGEQACTWPDGWGPCSAQMPTEEVCDGLDNDCDGLTDEGVQPPATPCVNTTGESSCQGTWTCTDTGDGQGVHWACDAPVPQVETCNGLDDDCDGQTDEGFAGPAGEALGTPCAVGEGSCLSVGAWRCSADTTGVICDAPPKQGLTELCNGLDDDCDGLTDEDFQGTNTATPLGAPCVVGQGLCTAYGVWVCEGYGPDAPPNSTTTCSAQPKEGLPELCNGLDDDCDGETDEGFAGPAGEPLGAPCSVGQGACETFGAVACAPDGQDAICDALPKTGVAEQCNGLDDDCDGQTDEDFQDANGFWTLDAHCGGCDVDCAGAIPHGTGRCGGPPESPACEVDTCDAGYVKQGVSACVKPVDTSCAPCLTDDDCGAGFCALLDDGPHCVMPCGGSWPACGLQYVCRNALGGGGPLGCFPTTNACSCTEANQNQGRDCFVTNEFGTCAGNQTCQPDGWSACSAKTPGPELCNGQDDDCDGFPDEDFPNLGQTCTVGMGACEASGVLVCSDDGSHSACNATPGTPTGEKCDGVDNDCNGVTDEPFLGDLGQPCKAGLGVCETPGQRVCAPDGAGTVCDADPPAPTDPEYCNGLDDDCDGETDEDFPVLGQPCSVGQGLCERFGQVVCSGDGYGTECSAVAAPSAPEQCDGLDNDCDGETDEGLLGPLCPLQLGVCAGSTATCGGAVGWLPCDEARYKAWSGDTYEPKEANCDTRDNDCDGLVDNVDQDGDGHFDEACAATIDDSLKPMADDCDDADPLRFPGHPEQCDAVDHDCSLDAWDKDEDRDGVVDVNCSGYSGSMPKGDCNDADPTQSPLMAEVCGNGRDDDCSGAPDDLDADGDGFLAFTCGGMDCNDDPLNGGADVHPGAQEVCNGVDDDCDGVIDNVDRDGDGFVDQGCVTYQGDPNLAGDCNDDPAAGGFDVHPGAPETCVGQGANRDDDCDGFADDKDEDKDGHFDVACAASIDPSLALMADDCDDTNFDRNPGLMEVCGDALDNDCDGFVDNKDLDGDRYGESECASTNTDPTLVGFGDCDDLDPGAHPGLVEVCRDAVDNDCNGVVDDKDLDGDTHYDRECRWTIEPSLQPNADDCDDNPTNGNQAYPGLTEVCGDGLDNDCDGAPDNLDADGDGFVDIACGGQDCDDDPMYGGMIFPGAEEICDGYDNDCDGNYDDVDLDHDGHIDAACTGYTGSLPVDDCADMDPTIFPGALEKCGDGIDQDCSGHDDDKDWDLDGHVDGSPLCQTDPGTAMPQDDCNDEAMESYPGASEGTQPDLLDNDCNGLVDDGTIAAGDVVITEMMIDPAAVPDAQGEWIEVYNNTGNTLNLATWTLTDGASESFTITAQNGVPVPAGGYAVLCRLAEWDYNGGVFCDVEYAGFDLSNVADTVTLQLGATIIDTVAYDTAQGWTVPSAASLQLDPSRRDATNNDDPSSWCASDGSTVLSGGDWASPKAPNVSCGGGGEAPYISGVYPNNGVLPGGEAILIDGMSFTGATGATIDGTPCTSFSVVDDLTIQCTTPPGTVAGPVDVVVLHPNGNATLFQGYIYTNVAADTTIDWCNLQSPASTATGQYSATETIYGRVHFAGDGAPPANLMAEVGFGAQNTDPATTPGWNWDALASQNASCQSCGPNYEYMAPIMAKGPGTFSYAYRFSIDDGITWSYCDLDGSLNGTVETNQLGTLTVNP